RRTQIAAASLVAWLALGACDRASEAGSAAAQDVRRSPSWSPEICEAMPAPVRRPGRARIATWNVRWFPDGHPGALDPARTTDVEWLACVITQLGVDAIALQEILLHERGRAALDQLRASLDRRTGGRWEAHDDGCPPDAQHLVLLIDRARISAVRVETVAALNPTDRGACGRRLRPGLLARLSFRGGLDLALIDLHLDSGTTARDHGRRHLSLAQLPAIVGRLSAEDRDVVVLGDLNTMGCRDCAPRVDVPAELAALETELAAAGLRLLAPTERCTEYSGSHRALVDHVAVARSMEELPASARAEVHGICAALACRSAPPATAALQRLSDHCPLVIELEDVDRD
ncbi:MAG: endonuclease/exonuclease/phosphatase family protein, partial [Myxococcota bacterium]|nr:endonuclease/exonuclease/phosphatase family protein [Myxococcota bacterium]